MSIYKMELKGYVDIHIPMQYCLFIESAKSYEFLYYPHWRVA